MRAALAALGSGAGEIPCGAAGTVLRFMALRCSRLPGEYLLTGHPQLLARPQAELRNILAQLGVECDLTPQGLLVRSGGWHAPSLPVQVDRSQSSQFASALALSAWELPFALRVDWQGDKVSDAYWHMTRAVLEQAGAAVEDSERGFYLPAKSMVKATRVVVEPDLSSAFALAALAAVAGRAEIEKFPRRSLQADAYFPALLREMGAALSWQDDVCIVERGTLHGLQASLREAPDLFPVLAALAALAEGPSRFSGATQLAFKESNRIREVARLVRLAGRTVKELPDGLEISGPRVEPSTLSFDFDPVGDHRLVMAAAVLRAAGAQVRLAEIDCVRKSFPEFIGWAGLGA